MLFSVAKAVNFFYFNTKRSFQLESDEAIFLNIN